MSKNSVNIPQPNVPIEPPEMSPEPTPNMTKRTLVGGGVFLVLLILILGISIVLKKSELARTLPLVKNAAMEAGIISPTPLPFAEMTVPFLREKEYKSGLGEQEVYANNGTYTSYLTNYESDGNTVNALLTIPSGEEPENGWPAVVFIHGYIPPTLYATTEKYVDYVDYIARNGFVVLKIDLRGHGNSEGEPGGGYYGSDYVIDALNARAALQSADFVNKNAVGMWGHSMAGNILMRSIAAQTDIPAVVIWGGAVYTYEDMRKYGIQDNSYRPPTNQARQQNRRRELFEKVGSPSATSVFWQQVAPTNYLTDIKGAIQLNHAVDDDVVNVGYSRDLDALLDKTSVVHELHEYPSGGHNIIGGSFVSAMENTVRFYKEHLK